MFLFKFVMFLLKIVLPQVINASAVPTMPTTSSTSKTTKSTETVLDPDYTKTKGKKKKRVGNNFERKGPITSEFGNKSPNEHLL